MAGLQAIATARRLGAVVSAFDVRPAVKEQVQSLGASFVEVGVTAEGTGGYAREQTADEQARIQQALAKHIKDMDLVDLDGGDSRQARADAHHRGDGGVDEAGQPSSSMSRPIPVATAR